MNNKVIWHALALFAAVLSLVACSDSSISSRDLNTETYLFYKSGSASGNTVRLFAVDPKDPGNPIEFDISASTAREPTFSLRGTVESAGGAIADMHYDNFLYARGGNIYKVSAERSNALVPRRVSTEINAARICDPLDTYKVGTVFDDYNNPDNTVLFYWLENAGDATPCPTYSNDGDETLYMVRQGMSSVTAPLGGLLNYVPVAPAYGSNGAITGFLVLDQTNKILQLRDADLASPTTLATNISSAAFLAIAPSGNAIIYADPGGVPNLYIFDPDAGTLGPSRHTEVTLLGITTAPADDNYLYFFDGDILYRLALNGGSSSSVVADESGGGGSIYSGYLSLSRDNLVYVYDDGSNYLVRSVPTTGGTPTTIYTITQPATLRSFRSAAGRVYLTFFKSSARYAVSIPDTGGSADVTANAAWTGFTYNPRQKLFASMDLIGRSGLGYTMARMKPNVIFQTRYSGGGTRLSSYDADTTAKLVDYGVPVADFGDYDAGLGGTYPPIPDALATRNRTLLFFGGTNSNDVLFVHARHGGSAVRVTNDADEDTITGVSGGCSMGRGGFDPLFPIMLALAAIYLWHRRKTWRSRQ